MMSTLQIAGRALEINNKGHMVHFDAWEPEIAVALAEDDGLALTDCHWTVIQFLRDFYAVHEVAAPPRLLIKTIGEEISAHVPCTRKHLDALFPQGGCKQACRIAGLPDYYCHPY